MWLFLGSRLRAGFSFLQFYGFYNEHNTISVMGEKKNEGWEEIYLLGVASLSGSILVDISLFLFFRSVLSIYVTSIVKNPIGFAKKKN